MASCVVCCVSCCACMRCNPTEGVRTPLVGYAEMHKEGYLMNKIVPGSVPDTEDVSKTRLLGWSATPYPEHGQRTATYVGNHAKTEANIGKGNSLAQWFQAVAKEIPNQPAMGWRQTAAASEDKLDAKGNNTGKKLWRYYVSRGYEHKSYADVAGAMTRFGQSLVSKVGMNQSLVDLSQYLPSGWGAYPKWSGQGSADRLAIYMDTKAEWIIACHGAMLQGITVVTVYPNLGGDAVVSALLEAQTSTIVVSTGLKENSLKALLTPITRKVNGEDVKKSALEFLADGLGRKPNIIVCAIASGNWSADARAGELEIEAEGYLKQIGDKANVFFFSSLVDPKEGGAAAAPAAAAPKDAGAGSEPNVRREDLAMIMYTSGTTGAPKGVMMSNNNLFAACESLVQPLNAIYENLSSEAQASARYCGFLPLSHILELASEHVMMLGRRSMIGYGTPYTLLWKPEMMGEVVVSKGGGKLELVPAPKEPILGDLALFQPAFMAGVPTIFADINKNIAKKADGEAGTKKAVGERALSTKIEAFRKGQGTPFWDNWIFHGIIRNANFGANLIACISGGGPLDPKVQEELSCRLGVYLGQGYGLTETCAGGTIQPINDIRYVETKRADGTTGSQLRSVVGKIIPGVEMKLRVVDSPDVPNGYYLTPQNGHGPQGEIMIKGDNVTIGYFNQIPQTEEAFSVDGWFRTGDVGEFDPVDGALKIIGRTKELVKNLTGEYVAPASIEAALRKVPGINAACICVSSHHNALVPVVSCGMGMEADFLASAATIDAKFANKTFTELADDAAFGNAYVKFITDFLKKNNPEVKLHAFTRPVFTNIDFSDKTGFMTAAMKLQRNKIWAIKSGAAIGDFANEVNARFDESVGGGNGSAAAAPAAKTTTTTTTLSTLSSS